MVRWQKEGNEQYVDRVEQRLLTALNFVKTDQQHSYFHFRSSYPSCDGHYFALNLVHRIPWEMFVTYESTEFNGILQFVSYIDYQGESHRF